MKQCHYPIATLSNKRRLCPSVAHTLKEEEAIYQGLPFCAHHLRVMKARFPLAKPLKAPKGGL
jgi:hypothetical protein